MPERIYNFSAGPATLPQEVLVQAAKDIVNFNNRGIGLIEMSHRSKDFVAVADECEALLRELLSIPDKYRVLFLQGGASTQFAMVPMNLLGPDKSATYLNTGTWSKKAIKEARLFGNIDVPYSSEETVFDRVPLDARKIDVSRFGIIFAGAQKNMGPAGCTVVIIRDDLLDRTPDNIPTMFRYKTHADKGSMFNTPPCFAIYTIGLVLKWLKKLGGLPTMEAMNREKAEMLYHAIDSTDFYKGHAKFDSRSLMNVTFNLPTPELEAQFIQEATAQSLDGLKGHRSVGGCRASIYNAFPRHGVEKLIGFMAEFEKINS
jgi:phosphoserine aminotransferase